MSGPGAGDGRRAAGADEDEARPAPAPASAPASAGAGDAEARPAPEDEGARAAGPARLSDRRLIERALDHGQLIAAEADAALLALAKDEAEGRRRALREVLAAVGVSRERVAAIDLHALEGRVVGGFRLIEPIGLGGVGCVFLAEQLSLRRLVAVKVLDPALAVIPQIVERFRREARTAARLAHPHVVAPIDFGEGDDLHYFAMEYLEGGSAAERLERLGPFHEREALRVVRAIAEALVYAEEEGILHRDIKPDNILFDRHGVPKLADLGLVLDLKSADPKLTARGMVMGSPHYMAPEQAQSQRAIDQRTDIYALGVTLFELLAGEPPFTAPAATTILALHVSEPLPDVRELNPAVSERTWRLIERMCAKDPADRPQAARLVVVEVDAILDAARAAEAARAAGLAGGAAGRDGGAGLAGAGLAGAAASGPAPDTRAPGGALAGALAAGPRTGDLPPPAGLRPRRGRLGLALLGAVVVVVAAIALYLRARLPPLDLAAEARGALALKTLLLSKSGPDGGFGDDAGQPLDPWVTAEAVLALALLEDPAIERNLAGLLGRYPALALDGAAIGDAPGFAGYPYAAEDNVATLEATAAIGLALAIARGRVAADTEPLCRELFAYLLRVQNPDGSWSTLPVLGPRGAMTSATAAAVVATAALGRALREDARAWPAVARGARWLAALYDREGAFFNVNPRRLWGDRRSIPGLDEECALALLEARSLGERLGVAEDALARDTLRAVAEAFRPFEHPLDFEGITRPEDYTFRDLDARYRVTTPDDRWVAYPFRLLLAVQLAALEDTPRRRDWEREARRLRARIPELAPLFEKRPPWQVAEALLAPAVLRHEGVARTLGFVDLVR